MAKLRERRQVGQGPAASAGNSRQDRLARMLRHAEELAERGYSRHEIETMLIYGGFPEAADKIWQPIISMALARRPDGGTDRSQEKRHPGASSSHSPLRSRDRVNGEGRG